MTNSRQPTSPWQVLNSQIVFQNRLTIRRDRLLKPTGDEMDYIYLASGDSASVLAFTANEQVVLTRQYRHPLRQVIFDLPAGGVREGESPEQAACRELAEETGFIVDTVHLLGRYHHAPGLKSGTAHVFTTRVHNRRQPMPDEHEIVDVVLMNWSAVVDMVLSEEPADGSLAYAVMRYSLLNSIIG